jgi:FKBP-type peptidyl-prolyl cis-trans isomerase FkpA
LALVLTLACSGEKSAPATPQAPAGEAAVPIPAAPAEAAAAIELPSGLVLTMTQAGSGPSPGATDTVRVHYHGTFPDGSVFDSSVNRGQPATFAVNRVIKCWTEGLQLMQVGAKASLICPPAIAYGPRGRPPKIPANSTLHFDVELLGIQ